MRRYNLIRPLLLIAAALLAKSVVSNICMLLGMDKQSAGNIGFLAMIATAFIFYTRITRNRNRK